MFDSTPVDPPRGSGECCKPPLTSVMGYWAKPWPQTHFYAFRARKLYLVVTFLVTVFPHLLESPGFFLENSRTWKVPENHVGPGKSWKLKLKVLESPGKIS